MSLFKARDWWATTAGDNQEEFDLGCLCVSNIDNNASGSDKLIVGSYSGILRIYQPVSKKNEEESTGFSARDVLCETSLEQPIICLAAGLFISGSDNNYLAVLHPRKLAVYSVNALEAVVDHGLQYSIKQAYQHQLPRQAFNMCHGAFGSAKGRHFICVQSTDGTLSLYEQETFAFSRFLPGSLLPGPIVYVPKTDSILTVLSSRQLECYKYQVLAVAADSNSKEEASNIKTGKRVASDWTLDLGEQALDMQISVSGNGTSIIVLGEHNLFCVSETGKLKFTKKFDFHPCCFHIYNHAMSASLKYMVVTHTDTLLIFEDTTVRWAAQLNTSPVQIKTANFPDLKGLVVSLDEKGRIECLYMGTEPDVYSAKTSNAREVDYDALNLEFQKLHKVIKENKQNAILTLPNKSTEKELQLTIDSSQPLNMSDKSLVVDYEEECVPSFNTTISLSSKITLSNIRISIDVSSPLHSSLSHKQFDRLESNSPHEISFTVYVKETSVVSDLTLKVTVTYNNSSGAPRVVSSSINLPISLVAKPGEFLKTAVSKLTVDTNKPFVNLPTLYHDFNFNYDTSQGNVVGFQLLGSNINVTVIASKTSQRYRLQSDNFAAIWVVLKDLSERLHNHYSRKGVKEFSVMYEGVLPFQEYMEVLTEHYELRNRHKELSEELSINSQQFIAVQKRLLTRFKDKTPSPLSNLDTLLENTYQQLMSYTDAVEKNLVVLRQSSASLSAATSLLAYLIKLWANLSESESGVLSSVLHSVVVHQREQGWEEVVDAAITHLLRTCLAKSSKDVQVNPPPLNFIKDTSKLGKHIALMCDRVMKGARLLFTDNPDSDSRPSVKRIPRSNQATVFEEEDEDVALEEKDSILPPSASYGQPSPRSQPASQRYRSLQDENRFDQPSSQAQLLSKDTSQSSSGSLPPLQRELNNTAPTHLPTLPHQNNLPQMTSTDTVTNDLQNNRFIKKQTNPINSVPDLDDFGNSKNSDVNFESHTLNGEQINYDI